MATVTSTTMVEGSKPAWQNWLGQVTTGIGALVGTPAVIAALTGQVTWLQAAPALIGAAIGLIWPENAKLQSASATLVTDMEGVALELISQLSQKGAVVKPPVVPVVVQPATPPGAPPSVQV